MVNSNIELKNETTRKHDYEVKLSTPQWAHRRNQIIQRDQNKCRNCGSQNQLQVHHKQYHYANKSGNFRNPWEYDDKYLITLCNRCHQKGHGIFKVPVFNV